MILCTIRMNGNSWSTFFQKRKKVDGTKHPINCVSIPEQAGIVKHDARYSSLVKKTTFTQKWVKPLPRFGKQILCVRIVSTKMRSQNSTPCNNKLHAHYFHGKNVDWKWCIKNVPPFRRRKKATKKPQPRGIRVEASLIYFSYALYRHGYKPLHFFGIYSLL